MKYYRLASIFIFSILFGCVHVERIDIVGKTIPVDGYELVWADEFNGANLDMMKWGYRNLGPRRKAINVKNTVSLDGKGHLVLTTKRIGNEYHTAMIGTQGKFETTFGYFECRAKLQKEIGHWSAFWLMCPNAYKGNPKVNGAEIDIFENYRQNIVVHTVHWKITDSVHKKRNSGKRLLAAKGDSYHTFGLEWTAEKYTFYINGKKSWELTEGVSHKPEYIILSLEVDSWAGDITKATLPDHLYVDYVRVYTKKEIKAERGFPFNANKLSE